ncbi:uncharacterized protein THITE_2123693 [Thermothielavioides terrestris NRRL 8126]|uniref:Golgi to ER traffic protein 2 n=2 Tax=Thermothielavioides terrestris TaxID=2587410 RepID=G2RHT0_THETT|nr:uncharacterized protein THITE_2123693 [Thermothielavioides terrestris NRRL 8126]AEO71392.1 hypothetical protein THITE_2123693 [Thermothielavioides terrestris NRRL 8126]
MTPEEEAASARAEEQARLRKARREAKIRAGAESRLKTITGLASGVPRDSPPAATGAPAASSTAESAPARTTPVAGQPKHADPEEVDISQHFYQPRTTARLGPSSSSSSASNSAGNISDAQLRQMMLGLDQPTPTSGTPAPDTADEQMLRMMMKMLGADPNSASTTTTTSPAPGTTNAPVLPARSTALYRLLHTLVALSLGLYIALYTPFTGTKLSRDRAAAAAAGSAEERERLYGDADTAAATRNFFWVFATAEALLLTTRHLLDRGRSRLDAAVAGGGPNGGGSLLGLVVGFLPDGVRGKVELAMRYGEVLGAVRRDVLICVFVLGVAAWWRG